ncbi:hypothetical protein ACEWY4_022760 [Coilia grayii]|uniref:Ig-like domain-containing protein n=1 Tax=Coilia grayii TaxID=363190 RepID=A0ABD1J1F8_9TELE
MWCNSFALELHTVPLVVRGNIPAGCKPKPDVDLNLNWNKSKPDVDLNLNWSQSSRFSTGTGILHQERTPAWQRKAGHLETSLVGKRTRELVETGDGAEIVPRLQGGHIKKLVVSDSHVCLRHCSGQPALREDPSPVFCFLSSLLFSSIMADLRTAAFLSAALCLGLCLPQLQPQLAQAEDCSKRVRVERVAVSSSVNLTCAWLSGEDLSLTLHKEGSLLHSRTLLEKDGPLREEVKGNLHLRVDGGVVVYELSQATEEDAGVYSCKLERRLPPPYMEEVRVNALYIVGPCSVPSHGTAMNDTLPATPPSAAHRGGPHSTQSPWLVACVSLSLLCGLFLVSTLVLGHKLRKRSEDNDYVNTPRRVQHPKWAGQF